MRSWGRRIRGALGMGVTWGLGWGVAGIGIGVLSRLTPFLPWDAVFRVFDAPLPALAVPGFVAGVLFSAVLGVAGRGRPFATLSLPRFAAWGRPAGCCWRWSPMRSSPRGSPTSARAGPGSAR